MSTRTCPSCGGKRLKPESLAVTINGLNISHCKRDSRWTRRFEWFDGLTLTDREQTIGRQIIKEIKTRLGFLMNVGLNYLTLDRAAATLAGGEAQRIRLATQIGSGLMGVLYILDEPSIGLHQRDNKRLIDTLHQAPRPRQHDHRGRARRGDDAGGRSHHRHRARRRRARRLGSRRRGHARGDRGVQGIDHRAVSVWRVSLSPCRRNGASRTASSSRSRARGSTTSRTST